MQVEYYDYFNIDEQQLDLLIYLYNWSVASPVLDTSTIVMNLDFIEKFSRLGLVESTEGGMGGPQARITEQGKRYLENVYPVELLLTLVRLSVFLPDRIVAVIDTLAKQFPLAVAPIFLAHKNASVRKVGNMILERAD